MRTLSKTKEFDNFFQSQSPSVQNKLKYALSIISEFKVVHTRLVKKLVNTEFYELRISVNQEYRVILFTIDSSNFIESNQILLLNGFVKKSTKDYQKQLHIAEKILQNYETED